MRHTYRIMMLKDAIEEQILRNFSLIIAPIGIRPVSAEPPKDFNFH